MSVQWFQAYEARFGKKLTDTEVSVWEEEIQREVRNLQPGEVINAVRTIAEQRRKQGQSGRTYAPTTENIVSAIIRNKYAQSRPQSFEPAHTVLVRDAQYGAGHWKPEHEPESSWKSRLHAASPADAWTIICEPLTLEQCLERRQYADENRIAYERFIPRTGRLEAMIAERMRIA